MLRWPTLRISPVGTTTVRPSTYSRVTPYLRARAAGVLRHVPADRAGVARVRVGRVEEPVPLDLGLEDARHDAGLDAGDEVLGRDLEDPVHPLDRDRDPAAHGERAAGLS